MAQRSHLGQSRHFALRKNREPFLIRRCTDAAPFLSISKRTLSRLIARRKIVARVDGPRTLVDVGIAQSLYEALHLSGCDLKR